MNSVFTEEAPWKLKNSGIPEEEINNRLSELL